MNIEEYKTLLFSKAKNSLKPAINAYLTWLYKQIENSLYGNKILEIGAGAGLSKNFMPGKQIQMTDYLPWDLSDVRGSVDAQQLDYPDNSFDSAFALDAIHLIPNPIKAISELCRVVRPGARL